MQSDSTSTLLKRLTGTVNSAGGGGMGGFGRAAERRARAEMRQNVRNSYISGRRS
jgi:hypothetical protein